MDPRGEGVGLLGVDGFNVEVGVGIDLGSILCQLNAKLWRLTLMTFHKTLLAFKPSKSSILLLILAF